MDKVDFLRLSWTSGVGPKTFWDIYEKNDVFDLLARKGLIPPTRSNVEDEIYKCEKKGIHVLCAFEEEFPKELKAISTCPPCLFVKGNKTLFETPKFGIVGARNVSLQGRKLAFGIAAHLKDHFIITSGFAKGTDTAAHEASLDKGTLAVFACGLDVIYPYENRNLYDKILDNNGLIVSEKRLGSKPTPESFPIRNRIIAGLAQGILIIEAAFSSGSLITARLGLDFGKDIFVVPGCPLDPRSRGGNKLIKDGAILVESASDILCHYDLSVPKQHHKTSTKKPSDDIQSQILNHLSHDFIETEELLNVLKIDINTLLKAIAVLEINGSLIRDVQGRIALNVQP